MFLVTSNMDDKLTEIESIVTDIWMQSRVIHDVVCYNSDLSNDCVCLVPQTAALVQKIDALAKYIGGL